MSSRIRIGAVSYLNTKPLLYGIQHSNIMSQIDLRLNYPAALSQQMMNNEIDIGLLPVAAIPSLNGASIISNYGIAAEGNVTSVALFSHVPLAQVKQVFLDYQSRTSVRLTQLLFEIHWKKDVLFLTAGEGYIQEIKENAAGVIIGDRALQNLNNFEYVYDLSAAWKEHTGLDFIFAAWVSNKNLPEDFVEEFNAANALGLLHLKEVIAENHVPHYDLDVYYNENIKYLLDANKTNGLQKFLELTGNAPANFLYRK